MIIQWVTKGGGQWSRTCSLNSLPSLFLPQLGFVRFLFFSFIAARRGSVCSLFFSPVGHGTSRLLGGRLPLGTVHNTSVLFSFSLFPPFGSLPYRSRYFFLFLRFFYVCTIPRWLRSCTNRIYLIISFHRVP